MIEERRIDNINIKIDSYYLHITETQLVKTNSRITNQHV